MKMFDRRVKEALLEKKPVVNQQEAWDRISHTLDNRSRKKHLILSFFLLSCLIVGACTLYVNWEEPIYLEGAIEIAHQADSCSQIEEDQIEEEETHSTVFLSTERNPHIRPKEQKYAKEQQDISHLVANASSLPYATLQNWNKMLANTIPVGKAIVSQELIQTNRPNSSSILQSKVPQLDTLSTFFSMNIDNRIKQANLPYLASESIMPPTKRKRKWPTFVFTYGNGFVPSTSSFSDLSLGEFAYTSPQSSQQYGLELQFNISSSWDVRTGFLSHSRRYRVDLKDGGNGIYWQYNYAIPLMLQYTLRGRRLQPYLAFGLHLNLWDDIGSTSALFDSNTQLGYNVKVRPGSQWAPVLEVGSSFWLFKQKFSIAAEANWGLKQTFETRFGIVENREIADPYGQGMSKGTYLALKVKYHLDVPLLLASIRDVKANSPSIQDISVQVWRKNEVGVEALGVGIFYSVYYQRFLLQRKGFRLGIKPGIAYIPTYQEQGMISAPPDDIKPMGLYVPLSLISYIGKPAFSLQLGLGNIIHYGPLRYPIPNGRLYDRAIGQFLITGIRGEYKRLSYHGQFNIGVDFEEPNTPVGTKLGFGIGYLF